MVAAQFLAGMQAAIRRAQQVVNTGCSLYFVPRFDCGNADTGGEMDRTRGGRYGRAREHLAQFLRHPFGARHVRFRQYDQEFIAAHPRRPVARFADTALGTRDEGLQQVVARFVSEGVVDLLEPIDVAAQKRQRMSVPLRARQFTRQILHEIAHIVGAGQCVGRG
jgi:hypothetical protein